MIKVRHLSKSFNGQRVLRDINMEIPAGELVVVLGESGSGKSVFLKHLIGLLKPDRGEVEINGVNISKLPEKDLLKVRRHIGYLFQEGALYDFMTVFENVAFPLCEHTAMKAGEIEGKVLGMLRTVGLESSAKKYPAELSGGMKKRAALARSIILDSRILFCDEPTSGLDPKKSREISDLIRGMSRQLNCTTVVTSHDVRNALRIADRLVVIQGGDIIVDGKPEALKASTNAFVKEFIG